MQMLGNLPWHDPRLYAADIPQSEAHWILLYSGKEGADSGRYSLLAIQPEQHIESSDFQDFRSKLSTEKTSFDNAWFGYLAYELRHQLELLPQASATPSGIFFPHLQMSRFGLIMSFDHKNQTVTAYGKNNIMRDYLPTARNKLPHYTASIANLASNMDKTAYLSHVNTIKDALMRGDLYQANLTRKFYGILSETPDSFSLFCQLCDISPSPYSAYLKYGTQAVISSSPERFLRIDANGNANMHPIKGSAPRSSDSKKDEAILQTLAKSEKDRAENLMIVDLCRNDLSRGCEAGSVKVDKLFAIERYSTVHHMVSSINGKKRKDVSTLELVADCFPPGSMTGAPKIKAMEICNSLEQTQRSIYSGAIGWFGGDGSADLSVVIRTLLLDGKRFEFQVGGGIVLDSDPHEEWRETLIKARAIGTLLGIPESQLEAL